MNPTLALIAGDPIEGEPLLTVNLLALSWKGLGPRWRGLGWIEIPGPWKHGADEKLIATGDGKHVFLHRVEAKGYKPAAFSRIYVKIVVLP